MKHWACAVAITVVLALATSAGLRSVEGAKLVRSDLTFEIYKDARKEYRWRLKAGNGKLIGISDEGYSRKDACQHAIDLIKDGAAQAKVEDHSTKD